MHIHRRKFLKLSSLATASLWMPKFLKAFEGPGTLAHNGRILVVLQLSGGNDGLNTVVPVRNDIYYRERPGLSIKREQALSLTTEAGLHPALTGLKSLYDSGHMAVLNNVGYPNPDRSHFRSMDIWHTGSAASEYRNSGWLGRFLDAQCSGAGRPDGLSCSIGALEIDDTLSLALKGESVKGLALQDARRLYDSARAPYFADLSAAHRPSAAGISAEEEPVEYLYKTLSETVASADYLFDKSQVRPSRADYPNNELGRAFRTISSLILGDADTSVYYVSHGSFDTHINQQNQQQRLFTEMNEALAAFAGDMKNNNRWNDVLVVTFSEFGRRVAQNASNGTDHGTANNMFFLGGSLRQPGLLNDLPSLTDLDEGDLKYNIDFRQVYATLLENWLRTDSRVILGESFEAMRFV